MPWEVFPSRKTSNRRKKVLATVWGKEKRGKTHFSFTFPEPIWLFNFDDNEDGPRDKFPAKEFMVGQSYAVPPGADLADNRDALARFMEDYNELLQMNPEGTVVFDTATALWQMIQAVEITALREKRESKGDSVKRDKDGDPLIYPYDYAKSNKFIEDIIQGVKKTSMDAVFINRSQSVYDSQGRETDRIKMQGYKHLPFLTNITLHFGYDLTKKQHFVEVESCAEDLSLAGQKFPNTPDDPFTYQSVFELLYG